MDNNIIENEQELSKIDRILLNLKMLSLINQMINYIQKIT